MKIGIDLGTTNSLIAYWTEGGPKIIPNALGKKLTPSVVSLDNNGDVLIGEVAKERSILYPELSASVFKRNMGTIKEYKQGKRSFLPEELSALVLKSLKMDAEAFLGEEVNEVVISIPAYFSDAQRKATKRAGELAGLKVCRLITEPTAAALAYGLQNEEPETKFLVFDLGGGTFDVSILELFDGIMEVRSVAGDNYLGGEDFTEILVNIFIKENNLSKEEIDIKTYSLLKKEGEIAKRGFNESDKVVMSARVKGQEYSTTVYRERYEKECLDLLLRLKSPIERALSDADINLKDIDSVLLVGGATKLSIIRNFVGRLFGKLPFININPDEVVALGAAVQAALIGEEAEFDEIILTDVCPYTLGTEVSKSINNGFNYEAGYYLPIIERNTIIPVSRMETLTTIYDYQDKIELSILQGESRLAKDNILLGKLEVFLIPKKAGEELVDVRYTYDINGLLEVEALVKSTGVKRSIIIEKNSGSMTEEEIKKRMEVLAHLKIHPKDEEKNKLVIEKGARLYEEALGDTRILIEELLLRFEEVLRTQDRVEIEKARQRVSELLDTLDRKGDF